VLLVRAVELAGEALEGVRGLAEAARHLLQIGEQQRGRPPAGIGS